MSEVFVIKVEKTETMSHRMNWHSAESQDNSICPRRVPPTGHGINSVRIFLRKYLKSKPWSVNITNNRKTIHIGYYSTVEEAIEARRQAEDKYFTHHTK